MSIELQDNTLKAKTDRGRWKLLSLMVLYLMLAVAVGAARSELQDTRPAAGDAVASQPATSAG